MVKRSRLLLLLCIFTLLLDAGLSQSATSSSDHPQELILAASSFIDIGPPFDYYSLYKLSAGIAGTDIEKVALTPPGDACLQPATTKVSKAHISQSIDEILKHRDPCLIPERELRREAKRCKRCLTFSGIHVQAQIACNGKPRSIRYEVLDRDLFATSPKTPVQTSRTMKLLEALDKALGGGDLGSPIFSTGVPTTDSPSAQQSDALLKELAAGAFDGLFTSDSISQLFKDSQQPHKSPLVTIESSFLLSPINPQLPTYPPIARAAHVGGKVGLHLSVEATGKVKDVVATEGPEMLRRSAIDAAKTWVFPRGPIAHPENAAVKFDLNCNAFSASTN